MSQEMVVQEPDGVVVTGDRPNRFDDPAELGLEEGSHDMNDGVLAMIEWAALCQQASIDMMKMATVSAVHFSTLVAQSWAQLARLWWTA